LWIPNIYTFIPLFSHQLILWRGKSVLYTIIPVHDYIAVLSTYKKCYVQTCGMWAWVTHKHTEHEPKVYKMFGVKVERWWIRLRAGWYSGICVQKVTMREKVRSRIGERTGTVRTKLMSVTLRPLTVVKSLTSPQSWICDGETKIMEKLQNNMPE
jgi:hypothetical protein